MSCDSWNVLRFCLSYLLQSLNTLSGSNGLFVGDMTKIFMSGLESDTIGGFNSMIEKQKKEKGEAVVSTVLFDNESVVVHDRLPLDRVPRMTEKEYFTRGCTALLDAVGGAIHHIGNIHKYARKEDVPEKTLFIITTDGYENASKRYDYERVRKMIER